MIDAVMMAVTFLMVEYMLACIVIGWVTRPIVLRREDGQLTVPRSGRVIVRASR